MRRWILAGALALGMSAVAGEGKRGECPVPAADDATVGVSAGAGGAADVEPGPWAHVDKSPQPGDVRQRLYGQVSHELGLDRDRSGAPLRRGEALGGGGKAGGEEYACAEALSSQEHVTLVSGTLSFASGNVLSIDVPGQGPMKLLADEGTCAVQARRVRSIESLQEGTEVRASYVLKDGASVARVVRAEPERPQR
ncbi:hypothetical protein [Hyalangium rubrum]|uniref:Lipoprotein n=1 Tax=Hyalangium rubrum TaxID=3103134 RepID=A0ABU5HDS0_9BACT|nr:hypothetical protein [Hyalangium sp. s54d21]MDY7231277.1 hypothetical protein [Hyalangium sp. s54d21]